jgi:hypothetical protein
MPDMTRTTALSPSTMIDGAFVALFDGLPTSASRLP